MELLKAKDYISLNGDILVSPIKKTDIKNLAVGTLVFYLNTGYRRRTVVSKLNSLIGSSGFGVVAGVKDLDFEPWVNIIVSVNKYPKSVFINGSDLDDETGTVFLFRARPLPLGDPRAQVVQSKFWTGKDTKIDKEEGEE